MCLARCRQRCEGHSIERLWAASAVYACRVPCPPVRCAYDLGGRTNPSDRVLLWKTLNQSESDALLSATEIAAMHGVGLRQRCCVRCRLTHGRVQGHGRAHGMVTGRVVWGRAGARVPPTSSRWFPARIPCPAQASTSMPDLVVRLSYGDDWVASGPRHRRTHPPTRAVPDVGPRQATPGRPPPPRPRPPR